VKKTLNVKLHSLFMDCNSIVYDAYHNIVKEGVTAPENIEPEIINRVIRKIEYYAHTISPTNILFISFDGVAPLAKMDQQRERRCKSLLNEKNGYEKSKKGSWNTCSITPGTLFMQHLVSSVHHHFFNKEAEFGVNKIMLALSDVPGEGEHKIFEYLRNHIQPNDNICVYGLDSDLIMLSIFHLNLCNNIYICKETPDFMQNKGNLKTVQKDELMYMDVDALLTHILKEMSCNDDRHRAYDYIFFCFMLGNDFLPHIPSLNIRTTGVDILLSVYKTCIGKYPNRFIISKENGKIQWKWVQLMVNELAKMEKNNFIDDYKYRDGLERMKLPFTTPEEKENYIRNIPIFYRAEEKYICPTLNGWEDRYYKTLFGLERKNQAKIKELSIKYLEGLEWTFKYYTEGCSDWKWKYGYSYPPLFSDLRFYIPHFETEFIERNENNQTTVHPNVQLAYVLPKEYHYLIPDNNTRKYLDSFHEIYDIKNMDYRWSYCRYFWETHLHLPEISLNTLLLWDKVFRE
jgi:5'-3' exonuclease